VFRRATPSLRAMLCLALGLVTTIAVAWIAPLIGHVNRGKYATSSSVILDGPHERQYLVNRWRAAGSLFVRSHAFSAPVEALDGRQSDVFGWVDTPPERLVPRPLRRAALPWLFGDSPWPDATGSGAPPDGSRQVEASGWPLLAFWMEFAATNRRAVTPNTPTEDVRGGLVVAAAGTQARPHKVGRGFPAAMPCRPIWSGLLLNTTLYASLWWLVAFAPGHARRALRRRRGLCPRCAYDLKGLAPGSPCPECGPART
jgi:hypothetical protein